MEVATPEFYTFPVSFIREHHNASSSWEKVRTRGLSIDRFKNQRGFEQIARDLRIPYPQGNIRRIEPESNRRSKPIEGQLK